MAHNTRGRLKECFEGIHRNNEWIKQYCERALLMLDEHNPKLKGAVRSLAKATEALDKLAQDVYGKL